MRTTRFYLHLGLALALALPSVTARPARAADALREELSGVAEQVSRYLRGRDRGDAIAVGAFTASTRVPASAGPSVQKALAEELRRRQVRVDPKAALEVKGDLFAVQDERIGRQAVRLKTRLVDRGTGDDLVVLTQSILGDALINSLLGLTNALPPQGDAAARDRVLAESIEAPRVLVRGSRVSAGPRSPYGVEVLVREGGRYVPRAPVVQDGLAFVSLRRGEVYAVRLVNASRTDAAVALTIDGLNLFAFSRNPAYRDLGKVVIPAGGEGLIRGWHVTDETSSLFLVGEYARSAAAELHSEADVGTITASFAAAWPAGAAPPEDEPAGRAADATARGPLAAVHYEPTRRFFGVVRDTVSIRYTR